MGSHTSTISRKNVTVIIFVQSRTQSRVTIDFSCTSQKFKILTISNVLVHKKLYEHCFMKKRDDHKLCAKSRKVEFRSIFCASSQKFKF
ncbi:hypothetical protein B296_00000288 [Ensete ventricosum]|uniref:Uncharacterized protein n=1 Tax=Ensete ventricosum TaxID=4639 RepID=A0A426ZP04_ENSVE|nr:hypothetical protein B296_00000288 [Ensete ventricosum]